MPMEPYMKTHMKDFSQHFSLNLNERRKILFNNIAQNRQVLLHTAIVLIMRKQFLEANYFNFPHHLRKMPSKQNTEPDPALLQPHQ